MFSVRPLRAAETPRRGYVILLALCVCCTLCVAVCADNIAWPRQVEIFAQGKVQVPVTVGGVEHNITTDLSSVPFFLLADGVMVAFAKGEYTKHGHRKANIVLKYIETEGKDWARSVTENNGANWKTQFAVWKKGGNMSSYFSLHSPMAVASGNKVYLFSLCFYLSLGRLEKLVAGNFDFHLAVGEIKADVTNQGASKVFEWQRLDQQSATLTQTLRRELPNATFYVYSAFIIGDVGLLFVFVASINGKDVSVLVSSNSVENATEWDVSYVYTPESCYDPCFVMWGTELLMFPNDCVDGNQTVIKSADMGKTWTTAEPSFVRLLDNLEDKDDLTVVTINNKTALMYTQELVGETVSGKRHEIHLWVSDGNRMRDIGPVAADDEYISSNGIVYTNGELFIMYQQWDNDKPKKGILGHLEKEIKKITSVLNTWDKMDNYLSKPCNMTATQNASSGILCATPVPIDGLVGFLSGGNNNNNYWRDKYLYVSAVVNGGTRVDNGFTFRGARAGAKWRLKPKGQRPYHTFVKYGITAVATVRIHSALGDNTPLLTIGEADWYAELQGLWYGSDGQWNVMSRANNVAVPAAGAWETNRTYSVALVVQNNTIAAYVDGRYVGGDVLRTPVPARKPFASLHLFIAGYRDYNRWKSYSNVTVTNVLLYDRQLNETEMRAMSSSLGS